MNTPVSFEIAKLLKEKGIKIDTDETIFYRDEINNIEEHQIKNRDILYNFTGFTDYIPDENEYQTYKISEVVMWCFNKYKYSIEYSMNIPESGKYDGCYVFNGLIKGSEDYKLKIFYTSKDYPTVEKALEDTINYFLVNFC